MTDSAEVTSGSRHAGREVALQVLYALDLAATGPRDARAARAARGVRAEEPLAVARATAVSSSRAAALSRATSSSGALIAPRRRAVATAGMTVGAAPPSGPAAHSRPLSASRRSAPAKLDELDQGEESIVLDPIEASGAAFDRITENFSVPGNAIAFARILVAGVAAQAAELDELVGQHARNWRVSRMAAVDRNVLRLAAYELRDTETPVAVVIDEAVDLARRFGSDTSPSFVNGILDAVAREVRAA